MRVIAFDPGKHVGFCVLSSGRGRPAFVTGGVLHSENLSALLDLNEYYFDDIVCAIEVVSGKAHRIRKGGRTVDISAALNATAHVAGVLEGMARAFGLEVLHVPAVEWRRAMCGKATANDATVKRAVSTLIEGWPARSSAHMRDAAGTAYVAMVKAMSGGPHGKR